jgi:hypothetical protein
VASKRDRNQEPFRNANERLKARLADLAWGEQIPYVCECPDPDCMEVVELTLAEYEDVRARENAYLIAPGHEHRLRGTVIDRRETYVVVVEEEQAA